MKLINNKIDLKDILKGKLEMDIQTSYKNQFIEFPVIFLSTFFKK